LLLCLEPPVQGQLRARTANEDRRQTAQYDPEDHHHDQKLDQAEAGLVSPEDLLAPTEFTFG